MKETLHTLLENKGHAVHTVEPASTVIDGDDLGDGDSFRVGDPGTCPGNPSCYTFTMPGGDYSLFLDQPKFWGRPTVVPNVTIPGSGSVNLDVSLPTDYRWGR